MIPMMMQEIRFRGAGGPDVIALAEGPVPKPGPNQYLVKVAYAGVNRPDCLQRAGGYPPPPGAPETPGLEISGHVVAAGEGAGLPVGSALCALIAGGGYAEYALVDAPLAMPVPKGLSCSKRLRCPRTC